jgi:hypothetical protein
MNSHEQDCYELLIVTIDNRPKMLVALHRILDIFIGPELPVVKILGEVVELLRVAELLQELPSVLRRFLRGPAYERAPGLFG